MTNIVEHGGKRDSMRRDSIIAVLVVVVVLCLDQLIKIWVKTHLMLGDAIIITDWFQIRFIENNGMAYGMTFINKLTLSLFRIVAVAAIGYYIWRLLHTVYRRGYLICLSLILAGAAGNIFDSMFYGLIFTPSTSYSIAELTNFGNGYSSFLQGKVVDMFYFPLIVTTWPEWAPWVGGNEFIFFSPIFNFADACISVGVIVLILFYRHDIEDIGKVMLRHKREAAQIIVIGVILTTASACKPRVPNQYLQKDEMEDFLYDYHLMQAIADRNHNDSLNQYTYLLGVLKKHNITETRFNESLVYYTRHADLLRDIYKDLSDRFSDDAKAMGVSASQLNVSGNSVITGDTADIWRGERDIVLFARPPQNISTFSIDADTSYHRGDKIVLGLNVSFVHKEGHAEGLAALLLVLSNDSVVMRTQRMMSPSHYSVTLSDHSRIGIKQVRGFFMFNNNTPGSLSATSLMNISNIILLREHEPANVAARLDSVTAAPPRPVQPLPKQNIPQPSIGDRSASATADISLKTVDQPEQMVK